MCDLDREQQGKSGKESKKSPKVNRILGGNKKISPKNVKYDDNNVNNITTEVAQELTVNKQQQKRHTEAGGWLYVFHHPQWKNEQRLIGKIGICLDIPGNKRVWRDRMKEHQKHYPCNKLILKKLYYIKHNLKTFETQMLSIYQQNNVQHKTFATKRSEFIYLNGGEALSELRNIEDGHENYEYLLENELPKSAEKLDVELWNNVEISDDEDAEGEHQEA